MSEPKISSQLKGITEAAILLENDPTRDMDAATKHYVDTNTVPNTRTINGETLDHDLTISGLPEVTSTDDGKTLTVQNGIWVTGSMITYREV